MAALPLETLVAAVRHALEANGVLPRLRADLRLSVFTALEETEKARGVHRANPALARLRDDERCRLALALAAETLTAFGLSNTRSCLLTEAGLVRWSAAARAHGAVCLFAPLPFTHASLAGGGRSAGPHRAAGSPAAAAGRWTRRR